MRAKPVAGTLRWRGIPSGPTYTVKGLFKIEFYFEVWRRPLNGRYFKMVCFSTQIVEFIPYVARAKRIKP